eukprot:gene24406-29505_t
MLSHYFVWVLICTVWTALAQVTTVVGPVNYSLASAFPNLNLDGIATALFTGIMQDRNGNFVVAMDEVESDGESAVVRFAPGSNLATLVAGTGSSTATNIASTSLFLSTIGGLAGDTVGNIYISDTGRSCIRRVSTSGIVTTFAGTCGELGSAVDNVVATSSKLNGNGNIFYYTATNNLYIADTGNHRIRMVRISNNIITTVVGTGTSGASDSLVATSSAINSPRDVWLNTNGVIYVAEGSRIVRTTSPSAILTRLVGASGPNMFYPSGIAGTSASIGTPFAVAGDTSGNLFIASVATISSQSTYYLLRVNATNFVFSYTVPSYDILYSGVVNGATLTSFGFGEVNRIIVSSDNQLTISSYGNGNKELGGFVAQVPRIFTASSIVSVIAGYSSSSKSIPATSMRFLYINGVWSDTNGVLYLLDNVGRYIVKSDSGFVTSVAGVRRTAIFPAYGATAIALQFPLSEMPSAGISGDSVGNVYYSHRYGINKISSTGIMSQVVGTNSSSRCSSDWNFSGAATLVSLCVVNALTVSTNGEIFFVDNYVVRRVVLSSGSISTIHGGQSMAGTSSPVGLAGSMRGLWLDEPRSLLYVSDSRHVVRRINLADPNPNATVSVYAGRLGVTSGNGNNVLATSSSVALSSPSGVCGSSNGDVYITQSGLYYIRVVFAVNQFIRHYVGTGTLGEGSENTPLLSTPVGAVVACFVDSARDTLYYAQGTNFIMSVRRASPLAAPPSSAAPTVTPSVPPSLSPTLAPTRLPTLAPTVSPSRSPSLAPTLLPSVSPTVAPTRPPTVAPSVTPSRSPSTAPTVSPSASPTAIPSRPPTAAPSVTPSSPTPTHLPTMTPTADSSSQPTVPPSVSPSRSPSIAPTVLPSASPTAIPSQPPTVAPSVVPSTSPSIAPTLSPSVLPTVVPTDQPTAPPTVAPSSFPSITPSLSPSVSPTILPSHLPTVIPTLSPSSSPSITPSLIPTVTPSLAPSESPSVIPSEVPTESPTIIPSQLPTEAPTVAPSCLPTISPTGIPSVMPSLMPSAAPSVEPSPLPSAIPSVTPSSLPTLVPSVSPSVEPSVSPSQLPSVTPTQAPSVIPSVNPTLNPTVGPTVSPSDLPTISPTAFPTSSPTVRTFGIVSFESTFAFQGSINPNPEPGDDLLTIADQQAIVQTQAEILETSPTNVVYVSSQADIVTQSIYATTRANLPLVDHPELANNGTALFKKSKDKLSDAMESGAFISSLQTVASQLNSTTFSSTVVTLVAVSDPIVISAPNYEKQAGLTVGQIAGLVVGSIVGTMLLMLCVWCFFVAVGRRKRESEEDDKESPEHVKKYTEINEECSKGVKDRLESSVISVSDV